MDHTGYEELVKRATKLDQEATPGPWAWDLRTATKQCYLLTTHSGQYYVMGFERWGMQEALPTFQVYDRYEGAMHDRGSHGMFRADKIAKSYPGKEHHKGYDDYIDNPDAKFIAESRELVHDLTTAITELLTENAVLRKMQPVMLEADTAKSMWLAEEVSRLEAEAAKEHKQLACAKGCVAGLSMLLKAMDGTMVMDMVRPIAEKRLAEYREKYPSVEVILDREEG